MEMRKKLGVAVHADLLKNTRTLVAFQEDSHEMYKGALLARDDKGDPLLFLVKHLMESAFVAVSVVFCVKSLMSTILA